MAKKNKTAADTTGWSADPRELLRIGPDFRLAGLDHAATPGWSGDEDDAERRTAAVAPLLNALQERLFAAAKKGSPRRVLVVAQGLDTAGKGGLARHVMGLVDPQGVQLKAFKAPTEEERSHDFLWRIRKAVPDAGRIGFFDRSHYEDILVPGAAGQLDEGGFDWHVEQIHGFERELVESGTAIVKVALMVSYDEQGLRLLERVDRPDKHWKYSTSDLDTRAKWFDYHSIYQRMLTATSFEEAPWYVVPADHKWYTRLAVTEILLRTLASLDVEWPAADFDVEVERERVRANVTDAALARYDAALADKLAKVARTTAAVDDAEALLAASPEDRHAGTTEEAGEAGAGKSGKSGKSGGKKSETKGGRPGKGGKSAAKKSGKSKKR